jgi:hypothetical protein
MSNSNPTHDSQSSKEVDLLDILRLVCKGIATLATKVWNALIFGIIYLIRKSLWLTLFVAIGLAVAIVPSINAPKYYASSAIVSSNSLDCWLVIDNLATINKLLALKNYAAVASILNISEADAAQLKSLVGHYGVVFGKSSSLPVHYVAKHDWRDTSLSISRNFFKIKVLVYNEAVYPALTNALLGYIGGSAFGRQSAALQAEQVKGQLVNINRDIAAMQQAIASHNSNHQNMASPLADKARKSEPAQMQEALSNLYAQKSELERQSALFTSSATFVEDFSKSYMPANRIRYYAAAVAAISFVLGVVGLVVWDNRKNIVAAVRNKK